MINGATEVCGGDYEKLNEELLFEIHISGVPKGFQNSLNFTGVIERSVSTKSTSFRLAPSLFRQSKKLPLSNRLITDDELESGGGVV